MKYVFGIDIGGTTVKCGLFSEQWQIIDKWELETIRNDENALLGNIAAAILGKLSEHGIDDGDVLGIGVGVPGPVLSDGEVLKCANLGWGRINARIILEECFQGRFQVAIGNDANVAALGEYVAGGGRGYDSMMMVTLGTGVGGGLIGGGRIVCGANGAAAELGHIIVDPTETDLCGCGGHGHLEQYASATGIVRMAKKELASSDAETSLRAFSELTAKDIFDEAKKGDSMALMLVDRLGEKLAFALTHVAAVVDPEAFVIGGGVSRAGQILLDAISRHYNDNILSALRDKEFRLAELGNDAGIYGAAGMIMEG